MTKNPKIPLLIMSKPKDRAQFTKILCNREAFDNKVLQIVQGILNNVKNKGDSALFSYAKKFDNVLLNENNVRLNPTEFGKLSKTVSTQLKHSIREAAKRIKTYHKNQNLSPYTIRTKEGKVFTS